MCAAGGHRTEEILDARPGASWIEEVDHRERSSELVGRAFRGSGAGRFDDPCVSVSVASLSRTFQVVR
jgi:hypothetical protein